MIKSIKVRKLTLLNPNMSPLRIRGRIVLLIKLDKNTVIKIKLYSFGFVSGFSNFSAIILTITIKIMLVIVETREAPICTMLDIKIVCSSYEHKLETPLSV